MASKKSADDIRFEKDGHQVRIRKVDDRVELDIDGVVHHVRFLDNGRPFTRAYVNSMVKDVREYAEQFVAFTTAQQSHWAALAAAAEQESAR